MTLLTNLSTTLSIVEEKQTLTEVATQIMNSNVQNPADAVVELVDSFLFVLEKKNTLSTAFQLARRFGLLGKTGMDAVPTQISDLVYVTVEAGLVTDIETVGNFSFDELIKGTAVAEFNVWEGYKKETKQTLNQAVNQLRTELAESDVKEYEAQLRETELVRSFYNALSYETKYSFSELIDMFKANGKCGIDAVPQNIRHLVYVTVKDRCVLSIEPTGDNYTLKQLVDLTVKYDLSDKAQKRMNSAQPDYNETSTVEEDLTVEDKQEQVVKGITKGTEKQIDWAEKIKRKLLDLGDGTLNFDLVDRAFTEKHHDQLTRVQFVSSMMIHLGVSRELQKEMRMTLKDEYSALTEQLNIFFDNFDVIDMINNVEDAPLFIQYRFSDSTNVRAIFDLLLAIVFYNLAKRLGISVYATEGNYQQFDYGIHGTDSAWYSGKYFELLKSLSSKQ